MGRKLLLGLMCLGIVQMAMAGVITFDTLSNGPLPVGYSENLDDPSIGWYNFEVAGVSGARYVLNGSSLSTMNTGSTFDFFAADFRSDPGNVIAETGVMYGGMRLVGVDVVAFSGIVDNLTTTFDNRILNLTHLLALTFTPGGGGTFNMDNVAVYNGGGAPVIPVPGAIVLGGIGTLCVGWLRRRRAI